MGLQRAAGLHQVHDGVRQTQQRRQLRAAAEGHQLGGEALPAQPGLGGLRELGRQAQVRLGPQGLEGDAFLGAERQAAGAEAQVSQFQEVHVHLVQGVRAHDAQLGHASSHVARQVRALEQQGRDARRGGGDAQHPGFQGFGVQGQGRSGEFRNQFVPEAALGKGNEKGPVCHWACSKRSGRVSARSRRRDRRTQNPAACQGRPRPGKRRS